MKTIYLIRHAKSSWKDQNMRDFDRPLNKRGLKDAPDMGQRMKKRGHIPELIISSEAKRAITTAKAIHQALELNPHQLTTNASLYHASPEAILSAIQTAPEESRSIAIVCHNPGISQLNYLLTGHPIDMVTCAVSKIDVDVDTWTAIFNGTGHQDHFDYPKNN